MPTLTWPQSARSPSFGVRDVPTRILPTHRIAITTRYLGPTGHRGSRILATAVLYGTREGQRNDPRRVTIPYDHSLDSAQCHALAAWTLAERMRADYPWPDDPPWTLVQGASDVDRYTFTIMVKDDYLPYTFGEDAYGRPVIRQCIDD